MENKSKPCQEFNKMYTLQTLRRGLQQLLTRSLQSPGSSTYPDQMVDQHLERTSTALKDSGDQDN